MLDLGFVSAILADQPFEKVIDFAAMHQFKCVELMCWPKGKAERRYAGVTHIDVAALDKKNINYIKAYIHSKQISISGWAITQIRWTQMPQLPKNILNI